MQISELINILSQPEGTNIDFKSKLHDIYHSDSTIKGYQRDEFIRDILSLANNNTATAGEDAYLIYGVEETPQSEEKIKIIGVEGTLPTSAQILDIVNRVSDPPIGDISCDELILNGKKIFTITIHPDPYLHETRRQLKTGEKIYSEHIVFIRHNQSIQIASAKERAAIQELRQKRINDRRTMHPGLLGAILTGTVGGSLSMRIAEKTLPDSKMAKGIGSVMGIIVFSTFGWVLGNASKEVIEIRANWHKYPSRLKILAGAFMAVFPFSFILMFIGEKKKSGRE